MVDRAFLRWLCVIAAMLFALLWLVSVTVTGFAAPSWIPPAGLLAPASIEDIDLAAG